MWISINKSILLLGLSSLFIGCANFEITGTMCNEIKKDTTATIPKECRRYSQTEAEKAFDKETQILSSEDAIEYTK